MNFVSRFELDDLQNEVNQTLRGARFTSLIISDPVRVPGGGSAENETTLSFGLTLGAASVTVSSGYLWRGIRDPVLYAGEEVAVATDHQYVYLPYNLTTDAFGTLASNLVLPSQTAELFIVLFCQCRVIDSVVSLERRHYRGGDIHLPGVAA